MPKFLKKFKLFTFLELVIVIWIIATLWAIAVLTLTNWFDKWINAKRYTSLKLIYEAVVISYVKDWDYVQPSKTIEILDSGNNLLGYQWVVDDEVIKRWLSLVQAPKDPATWDYFTYTKYTNQKWFEIWVFVQKLLTKESWISSKTYANSATIPYVQPYWKIDYCEWKFPNPLSMYNIKENKFLSEINLGKWSKIVLEVDKMKKLVTGYTKVLWDNVTQNSCGGVAPVKCVFGGVPMNEMAAAYPGLWPVIDNYSSCIDVQINRCENEDQCNKPDIYAFHNNYIYLLYQAKDWNFVLEQVDKSNEANYHQFILWTNIGKILNLVFLDEFRYIVIYEKTDGSVYYQTFDNKNWINKIWTEIQLTPNSSQVNTQWGKIYDNWKPISWVSSIITYGWGSGWGWVWWASLVWVNSSSVVKSNSLLEPECICRLPQLIDVYNDIYVIIYERDGKTYVRTTKNSSNWAIIISDYKLLDWSINNTNFLKLRDEIYWVLYKWQDWKGYLVSLSIDKNYEIKSILDIYSFTLEVDENPNIYSIWNYEFALMWTKPDLTNITLVSVDDIWKIKKIDKDIPQIFCPVKKMVQISPNTFGYVCLYDDKLTYEQISLANWDNTSSKSSLIEWDYKTILKDSEPLVDVVCESWFYKMNWTCLPIPVWTFIGCEPWTISSTKYPSIHYSFPKIKEGVITYSLLEKNGEVYIANIKCQNQNPSIDSETKGTVIYWKWTNSNYFSSSNWSGWVVPWESDIAVINWWNIIFDLGSWPITVWPIKLWLTSASSITLVNGSVTNWLIVKWPLHIWTNWNITHPNNDSAINHIVNLKVNWELRIDWKIDVSTKWYKWWPIWMNGNWPHFGKRWDRWWGWGWLWWNWHAWWAWAWWWSSQSMETIQLWSWWWSWWWNRRRPWWNWWWAVNIAANSVVLNWSIDANWEFQNWCAWWWAWWMIYLLTDSLQWSWLFNANGANWWWQWCWDWWGWGWWGWGKIIVKWDYSWFSWQYNINWWLWWNWFARHWQVWDLYLEHNDNIVMRNIGFSLNTEYFNNLNNKNKINLISCSIDKSNSSTIQFNELTLNSSTLSLTDWSIKVNNKLLVSSSTINWSGWELDLVTANVDFGWTSIVNSSVSKQIKWKNITVLWSSSLTHNLNGTSVNNYVNLYALENLTIDWTINVDAKWYNWWPYQGHWAWPYYGRWASKWWWWGWNGWAWTSGAGWAWWWADPDKLTVSLWSWGWWWGWNWSWPGWNWWWIVRLEADWKIVVNGWIYARWVSNWACAWWWAWGSIYLKSPNVTSKWVLSVAWWAGRGWNCWSWRWGAGWGWKIIVSATDFTNNWSLVWISSTWLNNWTYRKINY